MRTKQEHFPIGFFMALRIRKYRFVILKPAYALRLEDIPDDHALYVECMLCGGYGLIYPWQLAKKYQPFERIVTFEKKFKCTQPSCGRRGIANWKTVELPLE